MKKARGWFQPGVGLVILLSFVGALAGCAEHKAYPCALDEQRKITCAKYTDGSCMKHMPPNCCCSGSSC